MIQGYLLLEIPLPFLCGGPTKNEEKPTVGPDKGVAGMLCLFLFLYFLVLVLLIINHHNKLLRSNSSKISDTKPVYLFLSFSSLFLVQVWVRLGPVRGLGGGQSNGTGRLLAVLLLLQRWHARTAILPPITAFHSQGVRVNPTPFKQPPKQRAEDTLGTTPFYSDYAH